MQPFEAMVTRRRSLGAGECLQRLGDPLSAVYMVKSGSLKTYISNAEGQEWISSFHWPGDLVGADAIASGVFPSAVQALETTSLCEIPFQRLEVLGASISKLQRHLLRLMGKAIAKDREHLIILEHKSAETRLALLLISLARQFQAQGYSPCDFRLSMTRNDIASYLGIAVETVSRMLSRFHELGVIRVERKRVEILDRVALEKSAIEASATRSRSRSAQSATRPGMLSAGPHASAFQ
jgi:CRP/FNR family transcriptional regulator